MATFNQELMQKAKAILKPVWLEACIGALIFTVIITAGSAVGYVGELIVIGPMMLGLIVFLINLQPGRADYGQLFSGFNNFVQTLVAGLLYSLIVGIGICLLIVPGIVAACGLSMTFFIMADDPNVTGTEALKMSWEMMREQKWNFFCLQCRFIGWYLLSILTCGILSLWVSPYNTYANLYFYRNLRYHTY